MTRRYVELTHCPVCKVKVDCYDECNTDKPFTAYDVLEGLNAWGAASVPKEVVCYTGGELIHFTTPGLHRLVRMTAVRAA